MALNSNEVRTDFTSNTTGLEKGASTGAKAVTGLGTAAAYTATLLTALATGAFAIFIRSATQAASKAQETQNLFDVSFGDMAGAAEDWVQRTQDAVGVNDTTLKGFSGTLFNMTTSMGIAREGAFQMATGFTQLALDTSSFFNIPFEEAFNKIRAGLAGESEPLKQLGVLVTENTVKQTEFAQKILATGRELSEAEKVQGRAIVIAQGLSNAQGDLIRTQDSWANQTRLVGEAWTGLLETVGQFVTESAVVGSIVQFITDSINNLSSSIESNRGEWETLVSGGVFFFISAAQQTIDVFGFIVDGLGAVVAGLGQLLSALGSVSQWLLDNTPLWKLLPDTMRQSAQDAIDAVKGTAQTLVDAGTSVFEVGGQLHESAESVGNALNDMVNSAGKAKTETEGTSAVTQTYSDLLAALSGNIANASGEIAKSSKELKEQKKAIEEAEKAYRSLLTAGQEQFNFTRSFNEELRIHATNWYGARDAIFAGTEATQEARIHVAALAAGYQETTATLVPLELKTIDWGTAMSGVNDFLSEARGLMTLLGVESDSVLGKILGWATKLFDAFNSLTSIIGKIISAFGSGGGGGISGGGGGIGGLVSGIGSLFGIGGGAAGAAGAAAAGGGSAAAAGGAAAGTGGIGAAISSGASSVLGGISSVLAAIPVAGWIALAGVGVGLLVSKIFGGPSDFERAGEELGASFGGGFSRELQFGIVNLFEERGGTIGQAIQLSLGEIIKEQVAAGTANFDQLTEKAADTYSFLERGEISAAEAQKVLNESVAQLIPNVQEMGAEGVLQLERMLAAAQSSGVGFEGMAELARAYVERANELGIAVNDVVLEALGLTEALALLNGAVPEEGGTSASGLGAIATEAAAASDEVRELIEQLKAAGEAGRSAGGMEVGTSPDVTAQAGFFSPALPHDTLIQAHQGERVQVTPAGGSGSAGGGGSMTINVTVDAKGAFGLEGRDIADAITKMIEQNLAGAQGRLQRALGVDA